MSDKTIELDKSYLLSIVDDYTKTSSMLDFISNQLLIMHDNNNGEQKHSPAVTIFQIHAMLEALDGRLMDRESILKTALGIKED